MYGAQLFRSEWLGPLAFLDDPSPMNSSTRTGLPPAPAGWRDPVPADRTLFPLRGEVGGGSTSRSGSPGVNVTPDRQQSTGLGDRRWVRGDQLPAAPVTPPALAAEPDRDLTAAERRWSAGAGATGTAVVAWLLLLTALALALWAPRPIDPVTGVPSLTAVHCLLVPALALAGVWLLERLHRVTRRAR